MVRIGTLITRIQRILANFFVVFVLIGLLVVGCAGTEDAAVVTESAVTSGDPVNCEALYQTTCFACHGTNATGLPGQGKDLTTSAFSRSLTDEQFVAFVKEGRDVNDPLNTTDSDMPPYGGNPALSEQDLFDIVAFIRTLEK